MGLRLLYVTTRVQKVRFRAKKLRDHEKNKSKKYSVIKSVKLGMPLLGFFSKKVVCVFAFEAIRSIVNLAGETNLIYRVSTKEKLLIR